MHIIHKMLKKFLRRNKYVLQGHKAYKVKYHYGRDYDKKGYWRVVGYVYIDGIKIVGIQVLPENPKKNKILMKIAKEKVLDNLRRTIIN